MPFKPSMETSSGFNNLEDTVQEFEGVLSEYVGRELEAKEGKKAAQLVDLKFRDFMPIRQTAPYIFPIGTLSIFYNNNEKSQWGVLSKSVLKVMPPDVAPADAIDKLVGLKQRWSYSPATLRVPPPEGSESNKWVDREVNTWQLVSLEGYGNNARSINEVLAEMIDGKSGQEFNQALFNADASVKALPNFKEAMNAHLEDKLIPMLESADYVERDAEGVYHSKVKAAG